MSWNVSPLRFNDLVTLENELLAQVPPPYRAHFWDVPHPSAIPTAWHGIAPESLQAVRERLLVARDKQEPVLIFGDYDCDGVTATALLWEVMHHGGWPVKPFLPHREQHGYGLSVTALQEIWAAAPPAVVITVDNGIVAHLAVNWLKERGVTVIITDHHQAGDSLPAADYILHSPQLAGVSVSWLLAHTLDPEYAAKQLDYVALGTIADQVPLVGANRSFAVHGLQQLQISNRVSLRTLAQMAKVDLSQATPQMIGFMLAPRLNALGRLTSAMDALRALVATKPSRLQILFARMEQANQERQELTKQALASLPRDLISTAQGMTIITGEYHEGIIGLIAGHLVELTHAPSLVIASKGELVKASGRSLPGFSLIDFLRAQEDIPYTALGGHAMAAGFSLRTSDLEESVSKLRSRAITWREKHPTTANVSIIGELAPALLTGATARWLQRFGPFGAGHAEPVFWWPQVSVLEAKTVGTDGQHWSWRLRIGDDHHSTSVKTIWFGGVKHLSSVPAQIDVAYRLQTSNYPGREVEFQVVAARPA